MKKKILLFLVFICATFLQATMLMDYYHKDYEVADRSVFVFDKKPVYRITQENGQVYLHFSNIRADIDIHDALFPDGNVIESIKYLTAGNNLTAVIKLFSNDYGEPKLEIIEFAEKNNTIYKVVIDIIVISKPADKQQASFLANFYKLTGQKNSANKVWEDFEASVKFAPADIQPENVKEASKDEIAPVATVPVVIVPVATLEIDSVASHEEISDKVSSEKSANNLMEIFKAINKVELIVIVFAFVLILFAIRILINYHKLNIQDKDKENYLYPTTGYGSEEFRQKAAKKLDEQNWDIEAIAKELQLTEKEVEKLLEKEEPQRPEGL